MMISIACRCETCIYACLHEFAELIWWRHAYGTRDADNAKPGQKRVASHTSMGTLIALSDKGTCTLLWADRTLA